MKAGSVQSGELTFSVDSSLLFELGERLVAKPSIALAELVKNAYDADATEVKVTLQKVGKPGGTIIIEDDGHGMTFEETRDNWMRIATTAKRQESASRLYLRPLTGAKGIGRFAARRLGSKLTVRSTASSDEGVKERVNVVFDWEERFEAGEDLVEVPVSYTREQVAPGTETGVKLVIEGVRDAWTEDEIIQLRRDLLTLQSPFPDLVVMPGPELTGDHYADPGFNFMLEVEGSKELERLSGSLGEALLKGAWARLDGLVDEGGKARYDIEILATDQEDTLLDEANDYSGLEHALFRIHFFVYRAEYFQDLDFGVREMSRKGREEGGVKIYLDGFRVFPYGSRGDDWLRLDEYAVRNVDMGADIAPPERVVELAGSIPGRPFLLIPRNRQLFGAVAVSQAEHSDVEINVSRERLIETPAVTRLRQFVQNGIYWMTMKYAAFLAEQKAERRRDKKERSLVEILEEAKSEVDAQVGLPDEKRHLIRSTLERAIDRARQEEEQRISEVSMLRILASAGTTLILMNHQLQALTGAVSQTKQDLMRLRPEIPEQLHDRYDDLAAQVSEWHEMVELQVSQLGFLLGPNGRQRRRRHVLHQIVEDVRKPMSYYMHKYGVEFENNVPKKLRTPPVYRSELYAVLINILSNALKAVHGQPTRRVRVEAERREGRLFVCMKDTGVGLSPDRWEISFKPFETTSLPNPVLGVGTGLGLTVVRDILELYAGTARFIDVEPQWRTCIEILLPYGGTPDDG